MTELGLDLSKEFPKPLTDEAVRASDAVRTIRDDIDQRVQKLLTELVATR